MANIEKKKDYINTYTPMKSMRLYKNVKTSLQAINCGAETIGQIMRATSYDYLIAFINVWLIDLNEYLNLKNKLTPNQIEQISNYIIDDYSYLNIADFNLVFSGIKKGYYGQFFESIDGLKIMTIFEKYANKRANEVFESGLNEHNNYKEFDVERIEDSKSIKDLLNKG